MALCCVRHVIVARADIARTGTTNDGNNSAAVDAPSALAHALLSNHTPDGGEDDAVGEEEQALALRKILAVERHRNLLGLGHNSCAKGPTGVQFQESEECLTVNSTGGTLACGRCERQSGPPWSTDGRAGRQQWEGWGVRGRQANDGGQGPHGRQGARALRLGAQKSQAPGG